MGTIFASEIWGADFQEDCYYYYSFFLGGGGLIIRIYDILGC